MKRRYTDADKWHDEWFLSLPNDYRIVWLWLCDNCTPAGRIKKNFKMLNFCCDTKLEAKEFEEIFKDRVIDCGDFYFIPKFLKFQNPSGISSNKPAVVSIRKEIEEFMLQGMIKQSLTNDYPIIKGRGIGKGKGKGIGTGIGKSKEKEKIIDKDKYGEFCLLKKEEYQKLIDKFGETGIKERIERLNNYIGSKGVQYKSHYHTILSWETKNNQGGINGNVINGTDTTKNDRRERLDKLTKQI